MFGLSSQVLRALLGIILLSNLSCASAPLLQPQINSLVVAQRFKYALRLLQEHKESYGENNRLLYLLDYGLVLHLAGDYEQSSQKFEEAKNIYDQLYTTSVSKQFKTWVINDYYAPYRAEDFERVMINIFQALNYAMLGNIDEALVEARDVDIVLKGINDQYPSDEKNEYHEDAFARLLMGILYEHKGDFAGYNDSYISYQKSLASYEGRYAQHYGIDAPLVLKQNLLAAAKFMGADEFNAVRSQFRDVDFLSIKEKQEVAEVYLFYYYGLSPIKHQFDIPIPLPGGYFTKLAFPYYEKRRVRNEPAALKAVQKETNGEFSEETQEVQSITEIAMENLGNRKARVLAKAIARSGGKYMLERHMERDLEDRFGEETADVFRYVATLYNISSEQADLRSWQTLPAEIRLARLWLKPGAYDLYVADRFLGSFDLKAGSKQFLIVRTTR